MIRRLLTALAALAVLAPALPAQEVPPILLDRTRPAQGDAIRVCIDHTSAGAPFDQAVAQAIGDALFLEIKWDEAPYGFPISGGGYLAELQIAMANRCDMLMGIAVQANSPFPDWVSVTRAYASVPFVLAVLDPAYRTLADIPKSLRLGTALASKGEREFLTHQIQQPRDNRWRRLPYADAGLMLTRLKDATLAGILLYQPALKRALDADPTPSLRIIPLDPVPQAIVRVGAVVSNRDAFLRAQVDQAIDALVADGTIARLMEETGVLGTPGG
jgi:polar amino acid transport system substrate-binding protein